MRHAHEFFTRFLPFHQMTQANDLTGGRHWLFAKTGEVYAIYLPAAAARNSTCAARRDRRLR